MYDNDKWMYTIAFDVICYSISYLGCPSHCLECTGGECIECEPGYYYVLDSNECFGKCIITCTEVI